jgi:hypothetical protein
MRGHVGLIRLTRTRELQSPKTGPMLIRSSDTFTNADPLRSRRSCTQHLPSARLAELKAHAPHTGAGFDLPGYSEPASIMVQDTLHPLSCLVLSAKVLVWVDELHLGSLAEVHRQTNWC